MAVDSSSFQPSRIGFGSTRGAPLPAGRISKRTCVAGSSVLPMRPRIVPGMTLEPTFSSGNSTAPRWGPEISVKKELKVEKPGIAARLWKSWSSPPLLYARGRYGLANRRSLATAGGAAATAGAGAPALAGAAGAWEPAEAGAVGFGSAFAVSLSCLSTAFGLTAWSFGTGYLCESVFRRPYVYVLPYASRSMMNLPRRGLVPILTIRPSWTAITGEPGFA